MQDILAVPLTLQFVINFKKPLMHHLGPKRIEMKMDKNQIILC
jgi:hypothetical protein